MDARNVADQPWWTVLVVSSEGHGTTHISNHQAVTVEEAKQAALLDAAEDWAESLGSVKVRGVAAGKIDFVEWDDGV